MPPPPQIVVAAPPTGRIWRVGYRPDPWGWPDWKWAQDGRFHGRWDDRTGNFRTLYVANSLFGCLLEVLAPLRPDPTLAAEFTVIVEDATDAEDYPTVEPGEVDPAWLDSRAAGNAYLSGEYCAITATETVAALRPRFIGGALALGRVDFDVAALKDGGTRELTQAISTYIYETTDLAGLWFASRHGDELEMWAIFERAGDPTISPRLSGIEAIDLTLDTYELVEAFRYHRLRWRGRPLKGDPSEHHDPADHPPITGSHGELVDLFIELLDRTSATGNEWWGDYGMMAFRHFTSLPSLDASREEVLEGLTAILHSVISAGLDESFLIHALVVDIDEIVASREDTSGTDSRIDEMRAHLQRVVEVPEIREQWRQILGRRDPGKLEKTDEEMIEDAKEAYERFGRRYVSAEDASQRWAEGREWREARTALLPDVLFEHWRGLSIQRAIDADNARGYST
ncbi:MAG: hypothetical protein JWM84_3868 [Nocardioides sp.]|nr:hypothetical protein [Nocardioides sp.]